MPADCSCLCHQSEAIEPVCKTCQEHYEFQHQGKRFPDSDSGKYESPRDRDGGVMSEQLRVDIGRIVDVYSYDIQKLEGMDTLSRANQMLDDILQAITDAGYRWLPREKSIDELVEMGLAEKCLTGTEWLERLEQELEEIKLQPDWLLNAVLDAARKASKL